MNHPGVVYGLEQKNTNISGGLMPSLSGGPPHHMLGSIYSHQQTNQEYRGGLEANILDELEEDDLLNF